MDTLIWAVNSAVASHSTGCREFSFECDRLCILYMQICSTWLFSSMCQLRFDGKHPTMVGQGSVTCLRLHAPAQTCYGLSFVLERSVSFNVNELSPHRTDEGAGRQRGREVRVVKRRGWMFRKCLV